MKRIASVVALLAVAAAGERPQPPSAKRVPHRYEVHGEARSDDYHWLREKTHPDVVAYLEAENAYTEAAMKPTLPFQETLYRELLGRVAETDADVPYRYRGYLYYSRTEQGKQYPLYCRRPDRPAAPEQVVLDLNALAAGEKYMALHDYQVSDDGRRLAYSIDNTGFRQYTLFVKDLETGALLPLRAERTRSVAWAADNRTLFYTVEDAQTKRAYRVYRQALGEAPELIHEETDATLAVSLERTRSLAYLLLGVGGYTDSAWRFLPADQPRGEWRTITPRVPGQECQIEHHGERFYIRVNDTGPNFRLVSAPISRPGRENWTEVVAHRPGVVLEGVAFFKDHYVLREREAGLPRFRVVELASGASHAIEFPEPAYSAAIGANAEFETKRFRYSYQSLLTPRSEFEYDMEARRGTLLKQDKLAGGYDRSRYRSERLYATAPDGVRVPLSVVYRADVQRDGRNPALLYGYGAYGSALPAGFSSARLSLLDRGVVYAIAHVRGGGELGREWHEQGRALKKKNSFTDFIAAAEFLVAQKLADPGRLAIEGGSAGGLLVTVVANWRPELFKAVVADVPFVDVVNTMLDESVPLVTVEYEEWGNPKRRPDYDYQKSYDAYANIERQRYPAMLVRTSFNDSQVMYWEPAKYVARLRALKTDDNLLLLQTNMAAGHGLASGRYDSWRGTAFKYAFLLAQLGITR